MGSYRGYVVGCVVRVHCGRFNCSRFNSVVGMWGYTLWLCCECIALRIFTGPRYFGIIRLKYIPAPGRVKCSSEPPTTYNPEG